MPKVSSNCKFLLLFKIFPNYYILSHLFNVLTRVAHKTVLKVLCSNNIQSLHYVESLHEYFSPLLKQENTCPIH